MRSLSTAVRDLERDRRILAALAWAGS